MSAGRFYHNHLTTAVGSQIAFPMALSGLIVCPIPVAGVPGTAVGNAAGIYQLAFERAQEATRPSRYDSLYAVINN
jgi:hypothetical protein